MMPTIIFMADDNESELDSSLCFAERLRQGGYHIIFSGVSTAERHISKCSMDFFPIYESQISSTPAPLSLDGHQINESSFALCSLFFSGSGELEQLLSYVAPKLLILPAYLALEGLLLRTELNVPVVFLRGSRSGAPRSELVRNAVVDTLKESCLSDKIRQYFGSSFCAPDEVDGIVKEVCKIPQVIYSDRGVELSESEHAENLIGIDPASDTAAFMESVTQVLLRAAECQFR